MSGSFRGPSICLFVDSHALPETRKKKTKTIVVLAAVPVLVKWMPWSSLLVATEEVGLFRCFFSPPSCGNWRLRHSSGRFASHPCRTFAARRLLSRPLCVRSRRKRVDQEPWMEKIDAVVVLVVREDASSSARLLPLRGCKRCVDGEDEKEGGTT